jgi:hypothetical protein
MRLRPQRWFARLALVVAAHASFLGGALPALAQGRGAAAAPAAPQDLIQRGRAQFDDQQYEESIQTLSAALLRPSNTKAQKLEVYRLLALNYITLNRKDEAESAVRGLLSLSPEYTLPPSESPRFRDFFTAAKLKWESEGRPGLVVEPVVTIPVTMLHNSPASAERRKQLELTATLTDPDRRVTSVKLFYRHGSSGDFDSNDAELDGDHVRATIPAASVVPTLVEYYLQGFDKAGTSVVSRGDSEAPLRIPVPDGLAAWVLPVGIGGGVLVVAAGIITGVLLAGKSSSPNNKQSGNSTTAVTVNIGP